MLRSICRTVIVFLINLQRISTIDTDYKVAPIDVSTLNNQISIKWKPSDFGNPSKGFFVAYAIDNQNTETKTLQSTESEYTISDVQPCSFFTVLVTDNSNKISGLHAGITNMPELQPPSQIRVVILSDRQNIRVEWQPYESCSHKLSIAYTVESWTEGDKFSVEYFTKKSYLELPMRSSELSYAFRVRTVANMTKAMSSYSQYFNLSREIQVKAPELLKSSTTVSTIEVQWKTSEKLIELSLLRRGQPIDKQFLASSVSTHTFSNLDRCTEYELRIQAINNYRSSEIKSLMQKTLPIATPSSPILMKIDVGTQKIEYTLMVPEAEEFVDTVSVFVTDIQTGQIWDFTQSGVSQNVISGSLNVAHLLCNRHYALTYRFVNACGTSRGITKLFVRGSISKPDIPQEFTVSTQPNLKRASLNWQRPANIGDDCHVAYLIEFKLENSATWTKYLTSSEFIEVPLYGSGLKHEYRIQPFTSAHSSLSEYTDIVTISSQKTVPTPRLLKSESTEQTISVEWDSHKHESKIDLLLNKQLIKGQPFDAATSSHTFTNLQSCKVYEIQISALQGQKTSPTVNRLISTQPKAAPAPPYVAEVRATCDSIFYRLQQPMIDDLIQKIIIHIRDTETGTSTQLENSYYQNMPTLKVFVPEFRCDKLYSVSFRYKNLCGLSGSSELSFVRTVHIKTPQPEFKIVVASGISIYLCWKFGDVQQHEILFELSVKQIIDSDTTTASLEPNTLDAVQMMNTTENSASFHDLLPCTSYQVVLRAIDTNGQSSYTKDKVRTDDPDISHPKPLKLHLKSVSLNVHYISWNKPYDRASNCKVHYVIEVTNLRNDAKETFNTTETHFTTPALAYSTSYKYDVSAMYEEIPYGPTSTIVSWTGTKDEKLRPLNMTILMGIIGAAFVSIFLLALDWRLKN